MAMTRFVILFCIFFLSFSVSYANCNTNIPGHYEGRYTDNGNQGTITDNMTGLMWSKCLLGMTWDPAKALCVGATGDNQQELRAESKTWQATLQAVLQLNNSTGYGNFFDWRLPNVKEAASILEPACIGNSQPIALDLDYFKIRSKSDEATQAVEFWSSTPHRRVKPDEQTGTITNQAWKVVIRFGGEFGARPAPIDALHYARLVRGPVQ